MFYFYFMNLVLKPCQQEANEHHSVVELIGRHLTNGVSFMVCPLGLIRHTSMYLNGQTERSHRCIHAPAPYGRILLGGRYELN